MPIPINETLEELCIDLFRIDGKCIVFAGGAEICFPQPTIPTDNGEAVRHLLGLINTALAPLQPVFNIIDAIIALFECVQAIPDAITNLDPTGLIECIPDLVEKISKLLALIPQLSLPLMLIAIIDCVIDLLKDLRAQLINIAEEQLRIIAAGLEAAEPGNVALRTIVDCAQKDLDVFLEFANASLLPLNRLIGLIAAFLSIFGIDLQAGLDEFTDVSNLEVLLTPIDVTIEIFETVRGLIPVP